jgi:uroporphyrin-III C-methyltransferase
MPHNPKPDRVLLVGAGPGPADLLTVRALRAIESAEAILYDALIGPEVLDLAPQVCVRIQTGKRAGRPSMKQETINRLMLRLARRGLRVVRLKGGDPSIFGRVGEECEFLHAHGIETEVIPGVTAASAAAAQFDFPLTHRGAARRLLIATATVSSGDLTEGGWREAADPETTLALYMGRDQAGAAASQLMRHGRSGLTPAMAIENAGHPHARAYPSSLEDLAATLDAVAPSGPVVLLIGEVCARASIAASKGCRPDGCIEKDRHVNQTELFAFESDFVDSLRCIPMAVRFKLDASGVKLTLRQWSRFTREDRHALLLQPCDTPRERGAYRVALVELVALRSGESAKPLAEPPPSQWREASCTAPVVRAYALALNTRPPTDRQWAALTPLQRFVLVKLTRDSHDNINFIPAMMEFGLVPAQARLANA